MEVKSTEPGWYIPLPIIVEKAATAAVLVRHL